MHCLCDVFFLLQISSKTSRSMFSSKHRWNIASLSKKCDVLCDVLGFRWPGPTMLKMVRIFNINAYVIWYCWPCYYFCQQIIIKNTLLSHIVAKIKGFSAIFNSFKIVTKNIANMHREHDFLDFFKHRQKHRGRCFVKNIG